MIERLTLTDFRNHRAARLDAGPGFVVLAGENGAGKTNILEAISLLAPGRGMRRASLGTMARDGGAGGFAISAELPGDVTIGTGTQSGALERRIVRINGAAASAASLAEWLTLLWLTPAMDRLFVEPAGERRRFLDRLTLALEPGHATHATRYDAAMRARNRLLSEDAPADPDWLAALEAQMGEHGRAIAVARAATIDALTVRLDATPPGAFARALVSLDGDPGDALAERLAASRQRDAAAGRALIGPHRDDLIVEHRDKRQPAAQCSTGEQKALLLGIVLAHADIVADRAGAPPVLLLDEVAAHLDPRRRAALFDRLAGRGQVWMTGTEPSLFDDARPATRYRMAEGAIERIA